MPHYIENDMILKRDPFQTIDQDGVGAAGADRRRAGPADNAPTSRSASAASTAAIRTSIEFCHEIGLDYVSCSPFRVPVARLAAAHAAMRHPGSRHRLNRAFQLRRPGS